MSNHETHPGAARANHEHVLEEIASNIREIIWMYDVERNVVLYINDAYERITGRSVDSLYANPKSWREAVHPDDRARVDTIRPSRDLPLSIEYRILRPDGEVRWLWATAVGLRANGKIERLVGIVEDITDRKRMEETLETSVSLLRATLESTADGILVVDRDGKITGFNHRFLEMWRIPDFVAARGSDAEMLAQVRAQLKDPDGFLIQVQQLYAEPEAESFDILEFRDGRVFERYTRYQVVGGEPAGRVWSFHDITKRVRAEEALKRMNRRLELQNQVLLRLARRRILRSSDLDAALQEICAATAELLETERVGVWLFDEGHTKICQAELFERKTRGHTSGMQLARSDFPAYFEALEQERTIVAEDAHTHPATAEFSDSYLTPIGITSMLDSPVRAGGQLLGVVCAEHVGPARKWSVEDQTFAGSIADLVSLALETAELQRTEDGLHLLVEASRVLATSLDYRTTLANVARLAVPILADWCIVSLVENGELHRVAVAHADSEKEHMLERLERQFPTIPYPATRVVASGRPEIASDLTDEQVRELTVNDEHYRLIRDAGVRSYMAYPLIADGVAIGAITFSSATRNFDREDIALGKDLASRSAVAIENARLHEGARAASKAKSDFLAVMSHELRTPLSAITGYADLLEAGIPEPLTEKQKDQVGRIRLRAYDLLRMIEEILSFSRMEADTERFRCEEVDLGELIRDVGEFAKPLVEERGLRFRIDAPEEPAPLRTDPAKLRHILLALLSNATKFTDEGEVRLEAERTNGTANVRVSDTGIGIAPEHRDRIFDPFFQVEEAMTREKGGTGIGLAVARRLARRLGGDVTVESEPGRGSTFTVALPVEGDGADGTEPSGP